MSGCASMDRCWMPSCSRPARSREWPIERRVLPDRARASHHQRLGDVRRDRRATAKPLIVKLTPNASDVPAVARAAEHAGADALSLINTLRGMALHPVTGEPWLGGGTGGVSGPAVRPIALAQVAAVSAAVTVPVVGMGGVQSGRDALDLLRAGASLVAVGTESFRDPAAGSRIARELAALREAEDCSPQTA